MATPPLSAQTGGRARDLAVESVPTDMFLLYRRSHVGQALMDTLDELLVEGDLPIALAVQIVQQFDFCIRKVISESGDEAEHKCLMHFQAERLVTFRGDYFYEFILTNVTFYQLFSVSLVQRFLDYLRFKYQFDQEHPLYRQVHAPPTRHTRARSTDRMVSWPVEKVPLMRILCRDPFDRKIQDHSRRVPKNPSQPGSNRFIKSHVHHQGMSFVIERTIYQLPNPRLHFFHCSIQGAGGRVDEEPRKYEARVIEPPRTQAQALAHLSGSSGQSPRGRTPRTYWRSHSRNALQEGLSQKVVSTPKPLSLDHPTQGQSGASGRSGVRLSRPSKPGMATTPK